MYIILKQYLLCVSQTNIKSIKYYAVGKIFDGCISSYSRIDLIAYLEIGFHKIG